MILGAIVSSVGYADQTPLGIANYLLPTFTSTVNVNGTVTPKANWSYVKSNGLPAKGVSGPRTVNYPQLSSNTKPAGDYVTLPAYPLNKEFWFRLGAFSQDLESPLVAANVAAHNILELRDSSKILVAALNLVATADVVTLTWTSYNPADGSVAAAKTVATFTQSSFPRDVYGNYALDIRVFLDAAAGYVQAYNTAATLVGEVLGQTIASTATPYYAVMPYPSAFIDYAGNYQVAYAIVSTESTFGVYALPLLAKSAGAHSDMISGSYLNFAELLTTSLPATPVKLEASVGETKRADFAYASLSDIELPANFKLDALVMKGLFTAVNSNGATVTPKMTLSLDGSTFYDVATPAVIPNLELGSGVYQNKSVVLTTNPATLSAWQLSDISTLFAGVKLEA